MEAIFIDAEREAYSPSQIRSTYTAGELAEIFSNFDEDTPVYLRHDGGYTYGAINGWVINCEDCEDLDEDEEDEEEDEGWDDEDEDEEE